jgi:DNA-binding response OmpR family regulator
VLVVDTDRDVLELVRILLEARGYQVSTANGVAEAMRTRSVDLVLSATQLSDGVGSDLVGRFGEAPVIAMGEAQPSESGGFHSWLAKPISLAQLTSRVAAALS